MESSMLYLIIFVGTSGFLMGVLIVMLYVISGVLRGRSYLILDADSCLKLLNATKNQEVKHDEKQKQGNRVPNSKKLG
jgi:hypothetical protein